MAMKINVSNAYFSYIGNKSVLEDINFQTDEREVFCLLGPNGCGKSTLLKCIGGMLDPNQGDIFLDGMNTRNMCKVDIAKNIGYLPQEHDAVFPYTVLEMVVMGRAPHIDIFSSPSEEDLDIVRRAVNQIGISQLSDRPYTDISGGERQLTLLARVLAQEPKVMLMDEPTSHLDFGNQFRILNMINKFSDKGLSIIMTSHFPNHALLYSTRVALMKEGRIISMGKPDEVITEENLREVYEVDSKIITLEEKDGNGRLRICIPYSDKGNLINSRLGRIKNRFKGTSKVNGKISFIDIGDDVILESNSKKKGGVNVYIPPGEVILSRDTCETSSRNILKGEIRQIALRDGMVEVSVDVGKEIIALITDKSYKDMDLNVGGEICVSFKANSVKVY